ncbi:MAG TPA: hypothetical protein VFK48_15325 [Usitatibacter sp.]|nr:hypothetical protein [Usitatibacter sp.]
MKKALLIAAAPLVLLAACAGTAPATRTAAAAPAAGTQFCVKDKLTTAGDELVCNWASTPSEACEAITMVTLRKSNLASGPTGSNRCGNGQWLVQVQTR